MHRINHFCLIIIKSTKGQKSRAKAEGKPLSSVLEVLRIIKAENDRKMS